MTEEKFEKILKKIKKRAGIPESVTIYDDEFSDLINGCLFDMDEAGVPAELLADPPAQVINVIAYYVQRERAEDNKTADWYEKMYQRFLFRLSLLKED